MHRDFDHSRILIRIRNHYRNGKISACTYIGYSVPELYFSYSVQVIKISDALFHSGKRVDGKELLLYRLACRRCCILDRKSDFLVEIFVKTYFEAVNGRDLGIDPADVGDEPGVFRLGLKEIINGKSAASLNGDISYYWLRVKVSYCSDRCCGNCRKTEQDRKADAYDPENTSFTRLSPRGLFHRLSCFSDNRLEED